MKAATIIDSILAEVPNFDQLDWAVDLSESIRNVSDPDKKLSMPMIWTMLERTYRPLGGLKTFSTFEEMASTPGLWKVGMAGGRPCAVAVYKVSAGRLKLVAAGSDGSRTGRRRVYEILKQDLSAGRAWMEVSGPLESFLVKAFEALQYAVPNAKVADILGKPIEPDPDGLHYTRDIAGQPIRKLMLWP